MKRLVAFPIGTGGDLLVEIDEVESTGPRPAGVGDGVVERAALGLEQAVGKVRPLAEALLNQIQNLPRKPSEVTVEFGVKLNAEAGLVIASTAVEGNCKITMIWKPAS